MAVGKDRVYLTAGPRLFGIELSSGQIAGEFRDPSLDLLSFPTVVDDRLIVVTDTHGAYGIDPSGREVWRYAFGEPLSNWEHIANQPCLASPSVVVLCVGPDGYVHAINRSGVGLWKTRVGIYGMGKPALPIALISNLMLLDTRITEKDLPHLVALDLTGANQIRFSIDLGIDVSGLVADVASGIVATTYTEIKSHRGASKIVSLDEQGVQRWQVDRGQHEVVYAVLPGGDLVSVSQSADSTEPKATLNTWSTSGQLKRTQPLNIDVVSVLLGIDNIVYVVGCRDRAAVVQTYRDDLTPRGTLDVNVDCPSASTLDDHGRLIMLGSHAHAVGGEPSVEVTALQTTSPSAAKSWSVPRGHSSGSGSPSSR